jgi:hypothetical protein
VGNSVLIDAPSNLTPGRHVGTVFDPDPDPDGHQAALVADLLERAFR